MKSLNTDRARVPRWLALLLLSGMLGACSGVEPFAYTEVHEIQPGPGLFSGEDGEFVIYRR